MKRTILLVEDDEMIAGMLACAIRSWGYEALWAAGSQEALKIADERKNEISMVICDVVLSDGNGPTIVEALRSRCPQSRMLFTSGYPLDILHELGLLTAETLRNCGAEYLQKPFLPRQLRVVVDASLDGGVRPIVRCAGASL